MNATFVTDDINDALMADIRAEFRERAGKGDRAIFDFALDYSDRFCDSAQATLMGLMTAASPRKNGELRFNSSVSTWTVCARQALLDVLEKEVAPEWARTEYERRHQENAEMVDSWCRDHWGMEDSL